MTCYLCDKDDCRQCAKCGDLRSRLAMLLFHMIKPPEPDCTCVNSLLCPDCSNYRELRDVIAKAKKVFKEGDKP